MPSAKRNARSGAFAERLGDGATLHTMRIRRGDDGKAL